MLGFTGGFGDVVDAEVFEEVDAQLAGDCDVEIAVVVEVFDDDLGSDAGGAVVGDGDAGEGGVLIDFVCIDDVGS